MSGPFVEELFTAIAEKTYCSGTLPLSTQHAYLYYGKDQAARRLNFITASEEELSALALSCDPATFGRGAADVLDETVRKAGKLDLEHFSSTFNLAESGLMDIVRSELLEGKSEQKKSIRAELYKLNVYDRGAFFKAHKDTPRGEHMFGSLVVVFPARHVGGALLLRHGGKEWTIDAATEISSKTSPVIAYVAFYSDVEHEVTPVTSGHRVTLTYNLYFVRRKEDDTAPPKAADLTSSNEAAFHSVLSQALADPAFIPEGGRLGFGLSHQYPFSRRLNNMIDKYEGNQDVRRILKKTVNVLKGSDSMIFRVCKSLFLKGYLSAVYRVPSWDKEKRVEYFRDYILDTPTELGYVSLDVGTSLEELGAERIYKHGRPGSTTTNTVHWITRMTTFNDVASQYSGDLGNQGETDIVYSSICLIVDVGKFEARATIRGAEV
ncbi:hypothetical protein Hypma_003676 [Hypsizygus marmoreus]|uniref:Prolyl 4-hydroxylase alpha subunit Fe(2+) 2OG dioxygenase domain-containing protein n=1 Tax=Hypsizygus marmoreus TaxID=39966 RepID=A0A369JAK2_HYPMA|nr:hypothetical protein Hypma_003676 [Hypsizygus marmoreus]